MQFNHAHQRWEFKTDEAMIIEEGGAPPAAYSVWSAELADVEVKIKINGMMKELMMKLKLSDVLLPRIVFSTSMNKGDLKRFFAAYPNICL